MRVSRVIKVPMRKKKQKSRKKNETRNFIALKNCR